MAFDKIHGTYAEGVGDILVGCVPGWGCFENSVGEGGSKGFT